MSIMAWRYWRWGIIKYQYPEPTTSIVLHGSYGKRWEVDQAKHAICARIGNRHWSNADLPEVGCTCGIYALKHADDTLPLRGMGISISALRKADFNIHDPNAPDTWYVPQGIVLGVVELWGKIITAEDGYRAQSGQLRTLVCAPFDVATVYQVPNLPSTDYARREYFS
jgi:hypothetical protein